MVEFRGIVMDTSRKKPKTIDEYMALFPKDVNDRLVLMRQTIKKAAPKASETISYQIPTFTLNGNLVHFATFKNHIGFYPTSSPILVFKKELSSYKTSRGSIQFPYDKPLPLALITRIVKYRVKESASREKNRSY